MPNADDFLCVNRGLLDGVPRSKADNWRKRLSPLMAADKRPICRVFQTSTPAMAHSDTHSLAQAAAALPPLRSQDATADPSTEARFTFTSLHERLPQILDETVTRNTSRLGADAVSLLQALRNDLVTDKPLAPPERYCDMSREAVEHHCLPEWQVHCAPHLREGCRWSQVPWFFAENYVYAIVNHIMSTCNGPADPFRDQKEEALITSAATFAHVAAAMHEHRVSRARLQAAILAALWGNRADLSLTAGAAYVHGSGMATPAKDHLHAVDLEDALALLCSAHSVPRTDAGSSVDSGPAERGEITIVLDNCGLELLCDLALADMLLESRCAGRVVLLAKAAPVFVSDAMVKDVHRHIEFIGQLGRDTAPGTNHGAALAPASSAAESSDVASSDASLREAATVGALHERLVVAVRDGSLQVREHAFLHGPQPFWEMPATLRGWWSAPECKLVITKGDGE